MKMRKKLAALLAAAMVASVMPMTAFAASTNRVDRGIVKVAKDAEVTGSNLVIELKDQLTSGEAFYLELENAEWKNAVGGSNFAIAATDGEKVAKITATTNITATQTITIPLNVKSTGGEASVTIDSYGSVVTGGKYVFAVSEDAKAKVTVGDLPTIVDKGKMATITIEESYKGAFASKITGSATNTVIEIDLDDSDFSFHTKGSVEYKRGFNAGVTTEILANGKLAVKFNKTDITGKQLGIIEIKDVEVRANRKAVEGDVSAYISGDVLDNKTIVVAKYGDYSTTLTTEKVEEYTAGNKETLEFKLSEVGAGAIITERTIDFVLSEDIKVTSVKVNGTTLSNTIDADDKNEFIVTPIAATGTTTGSAIKLNSDNELKFEVEVEIPAKFSGDLSVKADGRAIGEAKELKLAEVKAPVTVKVTPMKIDVGQKSNKGGEILITETDKAMIQRGLLVIQLPKDLKEDGVEFMNVKDLVLDTTGGIRVDEAKYNEDKTAIEINVTRQSSETGSIKITGFEVKSRRMIADGAYEVEIGGTAISKEIANVKSADVLNTNGTVKTREGDTANYANIDAIVAADFLHVGNVFGKAEVVFNIGSEKFTVNGEEMTMDAKAYIKDGRTMVPLRYLSYALGIDEKAITFSTGIVTIFAEDGKIIQVKNGDKNLVINSMSIPMAAAAEIVEGRTYVPVTEIGNVFGVTGTWDAAAQTATFK